MRRSQIGLLPSLSSRLPHLSVAVRARAMILFAFLADSSLPLLSFTLAVICFIRHHFTTTCAHVKHHFSVPNRPLQQVHAENAAIARRLAIGSPHLAASLMSTFGESTS